MPDVCAAFDALMEKREKKKSGEGYFIGMKLIFYCC